MMSNKSVSLKFFETYGGRHDVEGCTPLFATDVMVHTTVAPGPMGLDAYKQLGYAFLDAFSDLSATVLEQVEEGNKVVSRVMWAGTHSGPLNGIPPTGRPYRGESIVIDTIEAGQIVERHEAADMLSLLQQLGVIPETQSPTTQGAM